MNKWHSPYQQKKYNDVLKELGVETFTLNLGPTEDVYFNSLSSRKLTAWEVDRKLEERLEKFIKEKESYKGWIYNGLSDYETTKWDSEKYYTLVLGKSNKVFGGYKPSNKRNIKKAIRGRLKHRLAKDKKEINRCLELFQERKELRGGMEFQLFCDFLPLAVQNKIGDLHITAYKDRIVAAALTLCSTEIANIRYVSSDKDLLYLRSVNFLYHSIIEFYFSKNYKYVDLSGIVPPSYTGRKLINIARFKRGFSNSVVGFRRI